MTKKQKSLLAILVGFIAVLGTASPYLFRSASLYWAKAKARKALAKYSPDNIRSLNALPIRVVLPPAGPDLKLQAQEVDDPETRAPYIIRFPPAQAVKLENKRGLVLTYPQFTAAFFGPRGSITDELERTFHVDWFTHISTVDHARAIDIDAQTDLKPIPVLLVLLSEKATRLPLYTYFCEFSQDDRCGKIVACDEQMHQLHATIDFPKDHSSTGIYFANPAGVDPLEIQKFLGQISIMPMSSATTAGAP